MIKKVCTQKMDEIDQNIVDTLGKLNKIEEKVEKTERK